MIKHFLPVGLVAAMFAACSQNVTSEETLKDVAQGHYLIGAAINMSQALDRDSAMTALIAKNFNAIVAENCMKGEVLHPADGVYDFKDADRFVAFGEKYGLTMTGHCLIWHDQFPQWFFYDAEGKEVSREVLIDRMREHIYTIVRHFKGKMKGWDVVNEAIMTDGTLRPSLFLKIVGPEFIDLSFQFAHEADPDVELYYNDFGMTDPGRRATVVDLVRRLKSKGLRIDAIGMQSHIGMDYPELSEYEKTLEMFAAEGVKVMATELDLTALPSPDPSFFGASITQNYEYRAKLNPYKDGLPDSVADAFNRRYEALFDIYNRHADVMDRVTFWGVSDGDSWRNNWPVHGRTDYPLAIGRDKKLKPFVGELLKKTAQK